MRDLVSARKTGSNVLEWEQKRKKTNKTRNNSNKAERGKQNRAYTRNVYNPSEKTAAS